MSKGKGYLLPAEITGYALDCVTLKIPRNDEYRRAFVGHLLELSRWWTWEKDGTTRAAQAARYWHDLLLSHLSISEDCEGEGVNCCDKVTQILNIQNVWYWDRSTQIANTYYQQWGNAETAIEIEPSAPATYGGNAHWDAALCWASGRLIDGIVEGMIEATAQAQDNTLADVAAVFGVVGLALALVGAPVTAVIGVGIAGALALAGGGVLGALTLEAARNAPRNGLKDCFFQQFRSKTTDYSAFNFAPLACGLSGDEGLLAQAVAAFLSGMDTQERRRLWQSFIAYLAEGANYAQMGLISNTCAPLPPSDTLITFNEPFYYVVEIGSIENTIGNPAPSVRFRPKQLEGSNGVVRIDVLIETIHTFNRVSYQARYSRDSGSALGVQFVNPDSGALILDHTFTGAANVWHARTANISPRNRVRMRLFLAFVNNAGNGTIYLDNVRLWQE